MPKRVGACALTLAVTCAATVHAQSTLTSARPPKISTVVERMGTYIRMFETEMATVVADEQYRQTLEEPSALPRSAGGRFTRSLHSDYVLLHAASRDEWVGFRDTFAVDGKPVHDHDERLQQLVASGALAAAERIANESARFNLAPDLVVRNINVPTFALHLLRQENHDRFSFRKAGEETIDGTRVWRIEYRERDRPTIVRRPDGRDQPSAGSVWVDPATGEVWKTLVRWDATGAGWLGVVTVAYGRVPDIGALVPASMSERYQPEGATLEGNATYAHFRRFQTAARVVEP